MLFWVWFIGCVSLVLFGYWIFKYASRMYLPDGLEYYNSKLVSFFALSALAVATMSGLLIHSDTSLGVAFISGFGLLILGAVQQLLERTGEYIAGGTNTGAGWIFSFDRPPEYVGPDEEVWLGPFGYFLPANNHGKAFRFQLPLDDGTKVWVALVTHCKEICPWRRLQHWNSQARSELCRSIEYVLRLPLSPEDKVTNILRMQGWHDLGPVFCFVPEITVATPDFLHGKPVTCFDDGDRIIFQSILADSR